MRFGAVFRYRKSYRAVRSRDTSYRAVRCGFQKSEILRCGSVQFSDIVNPTVRFGFMINPTVRFGAVINNRKSYGAVRCSFRKSEIYGAVRLRDVSYGPVRFGPPLSRFFYGAVPTPEGKAVQHTLFSTVHRIYEQY